MQAMKRTLQELAVHCHGDERPECPILEGLAAPSAASASGTGRGRAAPTGH